MQYVDNGFTGHEFFAYAGESYMYEPEKLKNDFPKLYDFYRDRVFAGREYELKDGLPVVKTTVN